MTVAIGGRAVDVRDAGTKRLAGEGDLGRPEPAAICQTVKARAGTPTGPARGLRIVRTNAMNRAATVGGPQRSSRSWRGALLPRAGPIGRSVGCGPTL